MDTDLFKFVVKNGEATLVKLEVLSEKVVIPDEFQGYPVKFIGMDVFRSCQRHSCVKELVLPKELEVIEMLGCALLDSVKKIELPESLREIHDYAFSKCSSLEEITFPAQLKIVKYNAFLGCVSLKNVTARSERTKVSANAFGKGEFLENISYSLLCCLDLSIQVRIFSEKIRKFSNLSKEEQEELLCYLQRKIKLRKELYLTADAEIVSFLIGLKRKLTLEMVEEYIESSIVRENTEVTAIFLQYTKENFSKEEREDYHTNKELLEIGLELPTLKQFKEKWKCTKVEGGLAISDYKGKKSHEIIPEILADGTKVVDFRGRNRGQYAPVNLGTITHLVIEAPFTTIHEETFRCCENLVSISLPDTVKTIEKGAFHFCTSLETVEMPKNLQVIAQGSFRNCHALQEITIPDSVEIIWNEAFESCKALEKVNLPPKIPKIYEPNFRFCPSMADSEGFVILGDTIYDYIGTAEIIKVPEGVRKIAELAFYQAKVRVVYMPESLEIIEGFSFFGSFMLEELYMNQAVKVIGRYAFQSCLSLKIFEPPENLVEIGCGAFVQSLSLYNEDGFQVFHGTLTAYNGNQEEITIPEGVISINRQAFTNEAVKKITFPSSLKKIEQHAFSGCPNLEEVIFSENLELMGDNSFYHCDKLTKLEVPKSVIIEKSEEPL